MHKNLLTWDNNLLKVLLKHVIIKVQYQIQAQDQWKDRDLSWPSAASRRTTTASHAAAIPSQWSSAYTPVTGMSNADLFTFTASAKISLKYSIILTLFSADTSPAASWSVWAEIRRYHRAAQVCRHFLCCSRRADGVRAWACSMLFMQGSRRRYHLSAVWAAAACFERWHDAAAVYVI